LKFFLPHRDGNSITQIRIDLFCMQKQRYKGRRTLLHLTKGNEENKGWLADR
jgi:hypothetical protein